MAKTELKTKVNDASVSDFLDTVEPEQKKEDCQAIIEMMRTVTKLEPKMWGGSIIGFGAYQYKYDSGHEGEMCLIGFSPRKANIALYIAAMTSGSDDLLEKLGKYKTAKSCLYINKLSDVDTKVFKELINRGYKYMKAKYAGKR